MSTDSKATNGDRVKNTIWYSIERVGLPTVMLVAVMWVFGRPLIDTYQTALKTQTRLAAQSVSSLATIEKIVTSEAAENRTQALQDIADRLGENDEHTDVKLDKIKAAIESSAADDAVRDAATSEVLNSMAACLAKLNDG